MIEAAFLIPGDLARPTGGYGYDRAVLARLDGLAHVPLSGAFPAPDRVDLEDCARKVAALPPACVLLIDGLAYGAMPGGLIQTFNRPIVALCHHPLALEAGLAPERAQALHACEQAALALAQHVIVTSPATADLLARDFAVPRAHITVARPGVAEKPRAQGSGGGPLQLLSVGALIPRKGHDVLITALARLKRRDWHLTIVGEAADAGCAAALREQIAAAGLGEAITLAGALEDGALEAAYAGADAFITASRFEGYGMALAEALARGLPIIATTAAAQAQGLAPGAALVVPPEDDAALAGALETLLADAALRARLAEAAHHAGADLPRWQDTADVIAACLKAARDKETT